MTLVLFGLHLSKVSNSATAVNLGIGVHDLLPDSWLWKPKSEVLIRVAGKIHNYRNWIAGSIESQETEDVLIGIAAINPLESVGVVV